VATVVSVTDAWTWRSRTDNIVVVRPEERQLLWVPRDLWITETKNRINAAFKHGGHELLQRALAGQGIVVDHSICLRREAVEQALEGVTVTVPVASPMVFRYPLEPRSRVQDGHKLVSFSPPAEVLAGERIHQWLGARYGTGEDSSDLGRIRRQRIFVRALLESGFDFSRALVWPELVSMTSTEVLDELRLVGSGWRFDYVDDVHVAHIDGQSVLVRNGTGAPDERPPAGQLTGPRNEARRPLTSEARDFFPALRTGGPRRLPIAYIVVHSMEAAGPDAAASAGRWFRNPDGVGSAHLGVDEQSTQRYLDDATVARGAQPINECSLHIEQAGFAEWSRDEWLRHGQTLMRCASKIAEWCAAHAIPPRLLGPGDLQEAGPTPDAPQGITAHASVSKAWGRSDHWDPGPEYPFDFLLEAVELFLS
jgi:cell envelope-related transcriptional attenuator-like protein/N-acetylmuramoyl-L-alanine amidase-like protein